MRQSLKAHLVVTGQAGLREERGKREYRMKKKTDTQSYEKYITGDDQCKKGMAFDPGV